MGGTLETPVLFSDGFESSGTSAWSITEAVSHVAGATRRRDYFWWAWYTLAAIFQPSVNLSSER